MSGVEKRRSFNDVEKTDMGYDASASPTKDVGLGEDQHIRGLETSAETSLHRGLKARHITMIAIGGAIGTGLIVGTGKALAQAGPGSVFICYTLVGFVVFLVMAALGEMAAWLPMSAGFTGYASRFCDPSLGFALGWTFFGELEFWLSSFKVITIIGIILFSLVLALGGGPDHDRKGFRYWSNPGAFKPYLKDGSAGQFLGFWSCMVNATFAYLGTELVGVTVAEAQNPRKTVPRAIKLTFYRILFFYCLSVLLVGMIVPYNSEELAFANKAKTGASASPFVVAADIAGVRILPDIVNACICVFVFSASNSDLYIASRTLYGLASDGSAPAIFKKTDKHGVPIYALAASASFCLLAFMNVADDSTKVFGYFVNLTTIFGLMSWISILTTHIWWCRAKKAQGITNDILPYHAPFGMWGSVGALAMCILIAFTKNFDVFVRDPKTGATFTSPEKYKTFITGYLGIPVYLALIFGHKIFTKSRELLRGPVLYTPLYSSVEAHQTRLQQPTK
ncbi:amino acid permease/ SLC12A domain-containing protein [Fusarium acuminatum]|uniref:Amino acid permease/ SLC12A domain-containing protein n=1 Tax=Fusarium acuminatum TaxID=5515 RepID=A0ABZ2WF97_9HYPO